MTAAPTASVSTATVCPACGSSRLGTGVPIPDREYRVDYVATYTPCLDCRTVFQTPMPSLGQLAAFYPKTYHAQTGRGLLNRTRQAMRMRRLRPLMGEDGAVLDFGCGNGAFLLYAAEQLPGRAFFGYEIGAQRRVERLANGAVTLVHGAIGDLLEVLPACRMITLNHVIEHLPDPLADARALVERLLPDGAFEGQTPAANSLEHRVFKTCWSGYHAPRHTVVFSPQGLAALLGRAGLDRVRVSGAFNPAAGAVSLAAVARRGSGRGIQRQGFAWLAYLGMATALAPADLFLGTPGIQNFLGFKPRG